MIKARCGSTVHVLAHGYHMLRADIHLESPQFFICEMGGSGHATVKIQDMGH